MIEDILKILVKYFYLPRFQKLERGIGYKFVFHNIPSFYINGWVSCDMTKTWRHLNVVKGANYFTMGKLIKGESSRFERGTVEYQSWFGAYTLKLKSKGNWTTKDHFNLAIADQNNWLKWYGDEKPATSVKGWNPIEISKVRMGGYSGSLYEFGCDTFSDVGRANNTIKLWLASAWMAAWFNLSNSHLRITGRELRPRASKINYEKLKLKGYIAIFDLPENVKVVVYANGFVDEQKHIDTFNSIRYNLLKAIESCEIVKL